jgi:hypothetical protein
VATFERLAAQFQEAQTAIGIHRLRQAQTEAAYFDARQTGDPDTVAAARAAVDKAVADVEWCKACTVAAGEEFKGEQFETVVRRNETHRARKDQVYRQAVEQDEDEDN